MRRIVTVLAAAVVITAGSAVAFGALTSDGSDDAPLKVSVDADSRLSVHDSVAATPAVAAKPAETKPAFTTSSAPVARIVIPSIGISQPTVTGYVDPRSNTMIAPKGASEIAQYEYSAAPGTGNTVFSGHVDYVNIGPAVFWNLHKLQNGDQVIIELTDGKKLRYAVSFNREYNASDHQAWGELFGPHAATDAVTLYTCDGDFDIGSQNYDKRRVIRADRVG